MQKQIDEGFLFRAFHAALTNSFSDDQSSSLDPSLFLSAVMEDPIYAAYHRSSTHLVGTELSVPIQRKEKEAADQDEQYYIPSPERAPFASSGGDVSPWQPSSPAPEQFEGENIVEAARNEEGVDWDPLKAQFVPCEPLPPLPTYSDFAEMEDSSVEVSLPPDLPVPPPHLRALAYAWYWAGYHTAKAELSNTGQ